ncbi:hypothetical protein, partial [Aeromonas veronii]
FHVEPPGIKVRENSTYEHLSFSGGLPKQVKGCIADVNLGYSLAGQPSWLVFDLSTKLPQTIRREALRGSLTQDFK